MENLIIRNVKIEDIPDVVEIQITGWKIAYKGIIDDSYLESLNMEERIKKRKKDFNQNGFIVAEINKKVVGFCRYIDNNSLTPEIPEVDCELLALYVKPDLKNNGIGTKLFEYVLNEFRNLNKTKMVIWCLKDNFPSRAFYEKMGGNLSKERSITFGDKDYLEVGFIYNIYNYPPV